MKSQPSGIPSILESHRFYFNSGNTLSIKTREHYLKKLLQNFSASKKELYDALAQDLNKPPFETLISEYSDILGELELAIKKLRKWSRPKKVKTPLLTKPGKAFIVPEPYGATLIMAPWNYPVTLAISPLIGAIAAGNTAVIKPSEFAPASAAYINKLVKDSFPADYVTVVEGDVEVSIELLDQHWDYIFFTGSTEVGKKIMKAASKHLTPVTLELGGKSPVFVDKQANLKVAAERIAWGKCFNSGQTCIGPDFLLVHQKVYAEFKQLLISELKRIIPDQNLNHLTKIINSSHFRRLASYINDGDIIFDSPRNENTLEFGPVILENCPENSPVMQEEIFGPVLPMRKVDSFKQAIAIMNQQRHPLALYYFSENKKRQKAIIKKTTSGGMCINDTLLHYGNKNLPFGGVGMSGMGKYHHHESFKTFSHFKAVQKAVSFPNIRFKLKPYNMKDEMIAPYIKKLI